MNDKSKEEIEKAEEAKKAVKRVASFYAVPGFLTWLEINKFQQHTAKNIQIYFSLFQRRKLCEEKKCHDCAGMYPEWDNEDQITKGLIRSVQCTYQKQISRELIAQKIAKRSLVPNIFLNTKLSDLPKLTEDVADQLITYLTLFPTNKPTGLYLYSPVHSIGRTTIMWIVIRELIALGKLNKGFIMHTTPIFADELQKDMFTKEHAFMHKARTCGLLLLDDFGRDKSNGVASAKIESIIEERTWNSLPVVFSSTIPLENWAWKNEQEKSLLSKVRKASQIINLYTNEENVIKGNNDGNK